MNKNDTVSDNVSNKCDNVSSNPKTTTTEEKLTLKQNIPEKIVLCIDISEEMKEYYFNSREKQVNQSFYDHLIKSLVIFIITKLGLNPSHEIAILVYADTAFWVSAFTRNVDELLEVLKNLPNLKAGSYLDLSIIFDTLLTNISLVSPTEPPTLLNRAILLYGRHFCLPTTNHSKYKAFKESNSFILDILYLYNPETSENQCEKIFDSFCQLDFHDNSYIMAASEASEVHQALAQMLGHPLQRPLQKDVSLLINADQAVKK